MARYVALGAECCAFAGATRGILEGMIRRSRRFSKMGLLAAEIDIQRPPTASWNCSRSWEPEPLSAYSHRWLVRRALRHVRPRYPMMRHSGSLLSTAWTHRPIAAAANSSAGAQARARVHRIARPTLALRAAAELRAKPVARWGGWPAPKQWRRGATAIARQFAASNRALPRNWDRSVRRA